MPAAMSAIRAIQDFYATLNAAVYPNGVQPGMYLGPVPNVQFATGSQLHPPYVELLDGGEAPVGYNGGRPWAQGSAMAIWEGTFTLDFFDTDLGNADAAWWATLWNGEEPNLHAGLAFCTLVLELPLFSMAYNCIPTEVVRSYAGWNFNNARVYKTSQKFTRRVFQDPNMT